MSFGIWPRVVLPHFGQAFNRSRNSFTKALYQGVSVTCRPISELGDFEVFPESCFPFASTSAIRVIAASSCALSPFTPAPRPSLEPIPFSLKSASGPQRPEHLMAQRHFSKTNSRRDWGDLNAYLNFINYYFV